MLIKLKSTPEIHEKIEELAQSGLNSDRVDLIAMLRQELEKSDLPELDYRGVEVALDRASQSTNPLFIMEIIDNIVGQHPDPAEYPSFAI